MINKGNFFAYKKIFLCITILISYNTKIYSDGYFAYTWKNSCVPTAILATLFSSVILFKEKNTDLIVPLTGIVGLSTTISGITCFSSIFTSKRIREWNCTESCGSNCTLHEGEDIKTGILKSLYRHSHRIGTLAGLAAGAGGYIWYKNHYA